VRGGLDRTLPVGTEVSCRRRTLGAAARQWLIPLNHHKHDRPHASLGHKALRLPGALATYRLIAGGPAMRDQRRLTRGAEIRTDKCGQLT
jgi:hypothetical protein